MATSFDICSTKLNSRPIRFQAQFVTNGFRPTRIPSSQTGSIRPIKHKRGHCCHFTPRQIRVRVVVPGHIKATLNQRFLTTAHFCVSSSNSLVFNRLGFYQMRAYWSARLLVSTCLSHTQKKRDLKAKSNPEN